MNKKIAIKVNNEIKDIELKTEGKVTTLKLPIKVEVAPRNFLHIGTAPSPLTEKKGAVFKVDRVPVIPATSFKGALRHQLEVLFIENFNNFAKDFNIPNTEKNSLKPCIPSPNPSIAEKELIDIKKYRDKNCSVKVNKEKISTDNICPVCYFMGAAGLMGFLRFNNFYPKGEGNLMDQTNIRIDRKTGTAAYGAKVECEQVKPRTIFYGNIDVVISTPILKMQGLKFGDARRINNKVFDKWLSYWEEDDKDKRAKKLIEDLLLPAIKDITVLGGQKSRGGGKVHVDVSI